jgi:hypothetical protein
MRYEIEAETDTGIFLLLDPEAIPAELDRRSLDVEGGLLDRLDRSGDVCVIRTVANGVCRIHLHVDEPIPGRFADHVRSTRTMARFAVPSGRIRFAGLEYALREENPPLSRQPRPGGSITLPPGNYRLTLHRLGFPEDFVPRAFRAEATTSEYLAWMSMKVLIPLAIGAWIGLVVIVFTTVRVPFPEWAAAVLLVVFASPFLVRRLEIFQTARARFRSLETECPSIVASLDSAGGRGRPPDGR